MKKAASLLALLCITACNQQKDTFTDTRDGKKYKTTKIGEQVWMAENLNYDVSGGRCYGEGGSVYKNIYDNGITLSSSEIQANCDKYGRLYNWSTAMKVCPSGWHLPSNDDWDKFYRYVDGDKGTESPYKSKTAGKYLKAKIDWNDYEGKSGNGEDTYGFSALPGGYGDSGGSFGGVGDNGNWWSSSENDSGSAFFRSMRYGYESAYYNYLNKDYLFSVRCVGD